MGLKPMKRDKDIGMIQEHTTLTYDIFWWKISELAISITCM